MLNARKLLFCVALSLATLVTPPTGTAHAAASPPTGETTPEDDDAPALTDENPLTSAPELLDLAFTSVSAMPLNPHIKNRSRAQEQVMLTCLELGETDLALEYAERIDNWRQGAVLADIANELSLQGAALSDIQPLLDRAELIADTLAAEESQSWRRDRIRAKIARSLHTAGEGARAASFETALEDSEAGWLVEYRAQSADAEQLESYLDAARQAAASGTYDQVRNSLSTCVQLHRRLYADEEARTALTETIEAAWTTVPVQLRIELLMELARSALDNADPVNANALVHQARALLDAEHWLPEHHVPLAARLASLRYDTGEVEVARAEIAAERRLYERESSLIVDIFRTEALLPLAESYAAMGDTDSTMEVWRLAVEEAVHNPNSRPRAEDLAAICCSIARSGLAPSTQLSRRLQGACAELGAPW